MADTFDIGGMKIQKKTAAIVGIGLIGIIGIEWYKNKQAQSAAAAANAQATQQAGQNEIDPSTGFPYGSSEDAAALQSQSNYMNPYAYNSGSYVGGQVIGYDGTGNPIYGPTNTGSFTSNAQWAQYVESYLESNQGADPTTVGNAIGKYITGQPLTSDMIQVVENAIAIAGYPPVSGANGNPPNFITANSPTPTPTPTPTPNTIAVPNVVGMHLADATGVLTAVGLKEGGASQIKGKTSTVVTETPSAGTQVAPGSMVTLRTKVS